MQLVGRSRALLVAVALLPLASPVACKGHESDRSAPDAAREDAAPRAPATPPTVEAGPNAPSVETNLPASASDDLTARARHLFEAIAHDNADLGVDMLFPREAFSVAHDSSDPGKVWDARISGGFHRGVHVLHKRVHGIEDAKFVSFELGHEVSQVTPKKRDMKLPLWRVHGSKLSYTLDGNPGVLEVAEMTSWRGNWYVTRLR